MKITVFWADWLYFTEFSELPSSPELIALCNPGPPECEAEISTTSQL
jgi:hypothetical protein